MPLSLSLTLFAKNAVSGIPFPSTGYRRDGPLSIEGQVTTLGVSWCLTWTDFPRTTERNSSAFLAPPFWDLPVPAICEFSRGASGGDELVKGIGHMFSVTL